jgi:hypothetical protein
MAESIQRRGINGRINSNAGVSMAESIQTQGYQWQNQI